MKFYVINLPRCVEQRQTIAANLQSLGLEGEFVEAVDGRQLTEEQKQLCGSKEKNILSLACGRKAIVEDKLSPSEEGCALSHLKVYKMIVDSGEPYAWILEDDMDLQPAFLELVEAVQKMPKIWDLVICTEHIGIKSIPWSKKYPIGSDPKQYIQRVGMHNALLDSFINPRRCLYRTGCYCITREACQHLLEIGYPVRMPADVLTGHFAFNHLRLYRPYPIDNGYYSVFETVASSIGSRPAHTLRRG